MDDFDFDDFEDDGPPGGSGGGGGFALPERPPCVLPTPFTEEDIAQHLAWRLQGQIAWTPGTGWHTWDADNNMWKTWGPKWVGAGDDCPRQLYAAAARQWIEELTPWVQQGKHGLKPSDIQRARRDTQSSSRINSWQDVGVIAHGETQPEWNGRSAPGTLHTGDTVISWHTPDAAGRPSLGPAMPRNTNHHNAGNVLEHIDWDLHDQLAEANTGAEALVTLYDWAECQGVEPHWANFQQQTHNNDDLHYLWNLWGAAVYGATTNDIGDLVHICIGTGANGKTVEWRTLQSILGTYWGDGPTNCLVDTNRGSGASGTDALWRYHANRILFFSELPPGNLNQTVLKQLASGEPITVNRKYADQTDYVNTALIAAHTNTEPTITQANDGGLWRRLRLVHYPHVVPIEDRDHALEHGFISAGRDVTSVITWAMAAATRYARRDLRAQWLAPTPAMEDYANDFKDSQDLLGSFLSEKVVYAPLSDRNGTCTTAELAEAYNRWRLARGHREMSSTRIGRELATRQHPVDIMKKKSHGSMKWFGMRLKAEWE